MRYSNLKTPDHDTYQPHDQQFITTAIPRKYHQQDINTVILRTRTRTNKNVKYQLQDDVKEEKEQDNMEEEGKMQEHVFVYDFLKPKVDVLLWMRISKEGEEEFLVKLKNRSYYHCQWHTKQSLRDELNYEVTSSSLKSVRSRMRKTSDLKLPPQPLPLTTYQTSQDQPVYFNPSFLKADRLLSSTQIFPAIHHKRANDIKGKWQQSILMVMQKLVNFVKNGYPYGVVMHEPYQQQQTNKEQQQQKVKTLYLGQIMNKVYLGSYKTYQHFWQELGLAFEQYFQIYYDQSKGDYYELGNTMKQCAAAVYRQWHQLSIERYIYTKKVFQQRINKDEGKIEIENEVQGKKKLEEIGHNGEKMDVQEELTVDSMLPFCTTNILLTQKSVDPPLTLQQLQKLNPQDLTFSWLPHFPGPATPLTHLTPTDLLTLNLNIQTDKLFYVKWCDLSYKEATWQSSNLINAPEKIEQFKNWNKIPVKEVRERLQLHGRIHKFLMDKNLYIAERGGTVGINNGNIAKMQNKLYKLSPQQKKGQPRQYSQKDIPIFKNYRTLKQFQLQSLNWLISSWYQNRNTILADQMGLGKTIQTIAFLYHLYTYENVTGPFLVLAPLTTLQQWRKQIQMWTGFNCLLYYDQGGVQGKQVMREYQFYHLHTTKTGEIISSKLPKFQVLLTNYELFISDFDILSKVPFQHMVLDQAHRLKNKTTKTTTTLTLLPCARKTLLTGTPIQNNTKELWTLLNFIEPRTFNNQEMFLREYGALSSEEQVKQFKKMLKPYLLRRVKQDVETTIPKLSQTIIDVQLSSRQKAYYRGILQRNKTTMLKGLNRANFNAIGIQLRKCCCHPYLISADVEAEFNNQIENQTQRFIKASGKTMLLMKLLQKFKKQGKKVLIFSQFVVMLDLLLPYLQRQGYNCQVLKGSQSSVIRHQAITRFNQQDTDVFLISTKAGGVGINLVAATEIIIYDSDWNPQNDIQATARAHRIGQKNQVNVYRLIIANSYQAEMFQMSSKKLGLDKAIFAGATFKSMGQFDQAEKQLTKDQIEMLLKKGIIGFLENQTEGDQYFQQSIEDILSKNARKVQYAVSTCTFSKTKFKSEENNDIKVDAPDFWEQTMNRLDSPLEKLVKKKDTLKQYSTLDKQVALLLEAYRMVLDFVKQKTLGTGFNAEDERKLMRFLQAINSERHINRELRDIADQLSMEIQKPSRRFKVKEDDILAVLGNLPPKKQPYHPVEKITRTTKTSKKMQLQNLGFEKIAEDEILAEVQHEIETPSDSTDKKQTEQILDQDFEKLCYLCQRPKCTILCKGVCGRSFHKKCFKNFEQGLIMAPESFELQEMSMRLQKLRQDHKVYHQCVNCKQKNYVFKCSICLQQGTYYQEQSKSRSKKAKKQQPREDQSTLYKCIFNRCYRFYHIDCLYSPAFQEKFADRIGKTVSDISNPSKSFRCPAHYCNACYRTDPKSTKTKSYTCIRCCKTYHEKCLDEESFVRLGNQDHNYICREHVKGIEEIDKIALGIRKFKINKKDKISEKKKNRNAKMKENQQLFHIEEEPKQTKKNELSSNTQKEDDSSKLRRSKRVRNSQPINEGEQSESKEKKKKNKEKKDNKKAKDVSIQFEKKLESQPSNPERSDPNISKKSLKSSSQHPLEFSYAEFDLIPISQFDFSVYQYPWCRYCGSRYAPSFKPGPWENSHLCQHHYQQWKRDRLHLDKYKVEPKKPINRKKDNQLKYLNQYAKKNGLNAEQTMQELEKQMEQKMEQFE